MRSFLIFIFLIFSMSGAYAGDRVWLGKARLWNNDEIGDRHDRWRTGSYSLSYIRGTKWNGRLPSGFGDLVEYRIRGELIAPRSIYVATPITDRRMVGVLTFGAFTHMNIEDFDVSMGVDLVFTGPQTGMAHVQSLIHLALGVGASPILSSQLGNAVYPTLSGEISRQFQLSKTGQSRVAFRPFLEAQIGVENYVRVGGDLTIGLAGQGDFQVRDVNTGHRIAAIKGNRKRGISFLLGGDAAYVQNSKYLPAALGPSVQQQRYRLRAGLYVEEGPKSLFVGATWLGAEFKGQPEGQVLGSFSLRMRF